MARAFLSFIFNNWALKLVSLMLAIGFWFYVVGEESVEITKTIPLEIISAKEKLSIVKSSTSFLEVTFQSPRHMFSALSSSNIMARHKIQGTEKPGEYSFTVQPSDFSLPAPEIRITKIFPPYVTVTLDELIVKKLPIKVELVGEPAFGYRIDEEAIELDPNAVLVEGPQALLEKMDLIKTEPIQLVGRVRSFRRTIHVQPGLEVKIVGDGITEVQIPIIAEVSEKELAAVPVKPLGSSPRDYWIELKPEEIPLVLKGPKAILEQVEPKDLLAYVEVEGLKEGTYQIPVKFILPRDIILKQNPPAISVEVKKN